MSSINKWKNHKRSGAFRRKVKNYYNSLLTIKSDNINNIQLQSKNSDDHQDVLGLSRNFMININEGENNLPADNVFLDNNYDSELPEIRKTDNEINDDLDDELKEQTELEKNAEFRNDIRQTALAHNISHMALKDLFRDINKRFPNLLPMDPRTLLKTEQKIITTIVGNGTYWHNGFEKSIRQILSNMPKTPCKISCNINMDGLPIYKSSKNEFWPILFNIYEIPEIKPMVIGIYSGKGKPSDLTAYLLPFANEADILIREGVIINNVKVEVKIRCFICDSPARAFIKGVMNFNGKHGCLKCTTVGEYSYDSHTVCFPRAECEKRTDAGFRMKIYGTHHKVDSPLLLLPINMIEDFPIGDSLHLIDLGIIKRCLVGWRDGSFGNYRTKLCSRDILRFSLFLKSCRMPSEIHRSVRELDVLCHWKGTEFRTFLYYLGAVILLDILPNDVYNHFLKLFCAVTISSSNVYKHYLPLAEMLLNSYVEYFRDLYGEGYISSNVHNLTHLVDEVRKFGPLNSFNSYPFENRLYQIKNLLRNGNAPLVQVAKRMGEIMQCENFGNSPLKPDKIKEKYVLKSKNSDGSFNKIEFDDFNLSVCSNNKWFLTRENQVIEMKFIILKQEKVHIMGKALKQLVNVFEEPIKSSLLNIFKGKKDFLSKNVNPYLIENIKSKLVYIEYNEEYFFFPLIHTLN